MCVKNILNAFRKTFNAKNLLNCQVKYSRLITYSILVFIFILHCFLHFPYSGFRFIFNNSHYVFGISGQFCSLFFLLIYLCFAFVLDILIPVFVLYFTAIIIFCLYHTHIFDILLLIVSFLLFFTGLIYLTITPKQECAK